jgi:nitrogen regulatory protein PII 2
MVTAVVEDAKVDDVVQAIIAVNKTGKPGDGKIFVLPVMDAVRVRTAEKGEIAIG